MLRPHAKDILRKIIEGDAILVATWETRRDRKTTGESKQVKERGLAVNDCIWALKDRVGVEKKILKRFKYKKKIQIMSKL